MNFNFDYQYIWFHLRWALGKSVAPWTHRKIHWKQPVTSDTVVRRVDSGHIWTISYPTAQLVHQQILLLNWGRQGWAKRNARTFVLKNFRSRERKFQVWNFHSREQKYHGTFAPTSEKVVEVLLLRAKKSWNFRSQSETDNLIVWSATKIMIATVQISTKPVYFSCTCT